MDDMISVISKHADILEVEKLGKAPLYDRSVPESDKFHTYQWLSEELEKNGYLFHNYTIVSMRPREESLEAVIKMARAVRHDVESFPGRKFSDVRIPSRSLDPLDLDYGGFKYAKAHEEESIHIRTSSRHRISLMDGSFDCSVDHEDEFIEKRVDYLIMLPYLNPDHFKERYAEEKDKVLSFQGEQTGLFKDWAFTISMGRRYSKTPVEELKKFYDLFWENRELLLSRVSVGGWWEFNSGITYTELEERIARYKEYLDNESI